MADGKVRIDVDIQNPDVKKVSNDIKQAFGEAKRSVNGSVKGISEESAALAGKMALGIGAALGAGLVGGIKAAGTQKAVQAQFKQVFGSAEKEARDNLDEMAKIAGMLPSRLMQPYAQTTSMFKGLGIDQKKAMELGKTATMAAADAAAFYDTSYTDANSALNSFIKGNYEGGEAIGLFGSETQMAAKAVSAGLIKNKSDWAGLTEAQKQMFRLDVATEMQKMSGAMGQAGRESDGLENVLGNLKQGFQDLLAAFGTPFLPGFIALAKSAADGMAKLTRAMEANPEAVQAIVIAVTALAAAFAAIFVMAKWNAILYSLGTFFGMFAGAAGPVFLIIVALGLLAAAIFYVVKRAGGFNAMFEKIGAFFSGALNASINLAVGLFDRLQAVFAKLQPYAGVIVGVLSKLALILIGITGPIGVVIGLVLQFMAAFAQTGSVTGAINKMVSGIVGMVGRISAALPKIINTGVEIVTKLIDGLVKALPQLVDAGIQLITSLVQGLTQNIPTIMQAATQLVTQLTNALVPLIPQVIQAGVKLFLALVAALPVIITQIVAVLPSIINALITAITTALPQIINAGIKLFTSLIGALPQIIKTIVAALPKIVTAIIRAIVQNLPTIVNGGIKLFVALVKALPQIIATVIKAIPSIVTALVGAIKKKWGDMTTAGKNLLTKIKDGIENGISGLKTIGGNIVKGVWQGIKDEAGWLLDMVKSWGKSIEAGIKKFFGIKSPSRLMRDEIGRFIPQGIAVGIEADGKYALNALKSIGAQMVKLTPEMIIGPVGELGGGIVSTSSRTSNYDNRRAVTVNNYVTAPDPVSDRELARQTKNSIRDLGYAIA